MNKTKEFLLHIIGIARDVGVLDETAARDKLIKIEFDEFTTDHPEMTVEQIITEIAKKKYLSYERIKTICYNRESEIELPLPVVENKPTKKVRRRYAKRRNE